MSSKMRWSDCLHNMVPSNYLCPTTTAYATAVMYLPLSLRQYTLHIRVIVILGESRLRKNLLVHNFPRTEVWTKTCQYSTRILTMTASDRTRIDEQDNGTAHNQSIFKESGGFVVSN
jgi:hypothetical protein